MADSDGSTGLAGDRAIQFDGTWREYIPIALSNFLLTIVTLGIYRFWATARERRYLWSRTIFIDDRLEWTGTGKEMFVGFLVVVAILTPFFLFVQFLLPALAARGNMRAAGGILFLFYTGLIYLTGFARFRALRYRLSRTYWRGIRGGSNNPGWKYGAKYLGRMALTFITAFIVYPWAATRLWNERWNAMSFGPLAFEANLTAEELKGRWALIYAAFFAVIFAFGILFGLGAAAIKDESSANIFGVVLLLFLLFYLLIPLATLHFFAKFYREAAAETRLGGLSFRFDASTWDWLKLFLGNLALAIGTLGVGLFFWGYRSWSFRVRHTSVYGTVDAEELTQSETKAPGEAEGFADAFDLGAI